MSSVIPRQAMILAAGLGRRMRPITDHVPKPMVLVAGQTIIDRALDRLTEAHVKDVVINTHYKAKVIERHLERRTIPRIQFSREETLLETGGGVATALSTFGNDPFYVINGDALWLNGPFCTLSLLAAAWRDDKMDALLLLHPTVEAFGYNAMGDFMMDPEGRLTRRREHDVAPYLFAGIQILHPRLFANAPSGSFSLNVLYDKAIEAERLYGCLHDGLWFHIGTPDDLAYAETRVEAAHGGVRRR